MLKKASFRLFTYRLNIALQSQKRQTWNGYFFLINENIFELQWKGYPMNMK